MNRIEYGLYTTFATVCVAIGVAQGWITQSKLLTVDQNSGVTTDPHDSGTPVSKIKYLDGHTEPVRAVGVSPDGKFLVSVGDDSRLIVRSVENLENKEVFKPREGGLRCMTFTSDRKYVLSGGNLADFSRKKDIDGLVRIDLKERKHDFIELPVEGTLMHMTLVDQDKHLVYFCANHELMTFDFEKTRFSKRTRLYGGFTEATAISPDSRHFAVTSQNEVNQRSAEPCRLTAYERDGTETLSYEFDNSLEYSNACIYFPTNHELILCLPTGKLLRWQWSETKKCWEGIDKEFPIEKGRISIIGSGLHDRAVWFAQDRTLFCINTDTGETTEEIEVIVGKDRNGLPADPIVCLAVINDQKLLVAGLSDGRLALVPIGESD